MERVCSKTGARLTLEFTRERVKGKKTATSLRTVSFSPFFFFFLALSAKFSGVAGAPSFPPSKPPYARLNVHGGHKLERSGHLHHERGQRGGRAGVADARSASKIAAKKLCFFERRPARRSAPIPAVRQRVGLSLFLLCRSASPATAALDRGERFCGPDSGRRRPLERLFVAVVAPLCRRPSFRASRARVGAQRAGVAAGPGVAVHPRLDAGGRVSVSTGGKGAERGAGKNGRRR